MNNVYMVNVPMHGKAPIGVLTAYEKKNGIPFEIKRVYTVTEAERTRGFHAHKELEQMFIATQGEIKVACEDDEGNKESYVLNSPGQVFYCGPMVWHTLEYGKDAILLVLASDEYNEADYIRNYDEFLERRK